jgi:hypothetical protein
MRVEVSTRDWYKGDEQYRRCLHDGVNMISHIMLTL